VPSTKSSVVCQMVRLPAALASLNNGHSFDLRAYYVGMRSSSRPNLVPARSLRLRNATWRSLFVANLNSTTPKRTLAIGVGPHTIVGCYHEVMMTLARNLIWPCNNSVLSRCTSSFLILFSLASKLVRRKLSLHSSCLAHQPGSPYPG
jgi:hypothetical protein